MPLGTVMSFWAVSVLFVLTPGAEWAYTISAGLRNRTVFPAVGGVLAGHLLATAAVAAGVAALLAGTPAVLTALTIAGAAYLVWLGAGMLAGSATPLEADPGADTGSWARQALTGLGVSGLNPKVFLLFLALLPQFVDDAEPWPAWVQILTLGLVHVANCAVVYLLVGTGARTVLRTRPSIAQTVTKVSGGAMALIGVVLIVEQVFGA